MPRVLLVNPNHEDYLCDGVFHGLRTLLGEDAVDFPKAEFLYETASEAVLGRVRGGAFTLYGLLADVEIARDHVLPRALAGEFDLVIFGDIWRTFGLWSEWGPQLRSAGVRMAILDGADRVEPYPYAGLWWRRRGWWFLPRAHNRAPYFKREITPATRWFASYLMLPPAFGRSLGLRPISFSIPEEKIVAAPPSKEAEFARHIVDPEVAERVGGQTAYPFDERGRLPRRPPALALRRHHQARRVGRAAPLRDRRQRRRPMLSRARPQAGRLRPVRARLAQLHLLSRRGRAARARPLRRRGGVLGPAGRGARMGACEHDARSAPGSSCRPVTWTCRRG